MPPLTHREMDKEEKRERGGRRGTGLGRDWELEMKNVKKTLREVKKKLQKRPPQCAAESKVDVK